MDNTANNSLPLAGVTVLELGMVLAGPYAGSLLADLGATVIKIEPPEVGDAARQMGPRKDGVALWFGVMARGKKCITLNLKDPSARTLFERLVATADVVVENYRPGVLQRLGLGWERLHAINPQLVMLSVTGFGGTGPDSARPGFGKIAEGMSGQVWMTGSPEQNPLFVGYSLADTTAGLFGVYAINLALYRRDVQSAGGAFIDLALYEPMLRMTDAQFAMRRVMGDVPARTGSNDPYGWGRADPRDLFAFVQTSDERWIEVVVPNTARASVCALVGHNVATNPDDDALRGRLQYWARTKAFDDVARELQEASAKAAPVLDGLTIPQIEYFRERGDALDASDPKVGNFHVTGFFPKHYQRPDARPFDGPSVGAHNREIFIERLGLGEDELTRLKQSGAI